MYLAGDAVALSFSLVTPSGVTLAPTSAQFQVEGPGGIITAWAAVTIPNPNPTPGVLTVTVPGGSNVISTMLPTGGVTELATREGRVVYLQVTDPSQAAPVQFTQDYMIGETDQLVLMLNSFQTYPQAVSQAYEIPDLTAWPSATADQRMVALSSAFSAVSRLNFEIYYDRDDVYFRQRASWGLPYLNTIGNLYNYSATDFLALDPDFIQAVCKAQVVEADVRLGGGSPVDQAREEGIIARKVGEDSITMRPAKPLQFIVDKRTLKYLVGYVKYAPRLTRT
jgi:hypothetical protein